MQHEIPEQLNIADWFLDARVRDGGGERNALLTDAGALTYRQVQEQANRFGNLLRRAGVQPEQRVIIALPDSPQWVAAFFGILKIGAVVVMVNPDLKPDAIEYFYDTTRAKVAIVHTETAEAFHEAAATARHPVRLLVLGDAQVETALSGSSDQLEPFASHRDDAAIWIFSGGTTGRPKAVVQRHASFVNTTLCYAHQVIGYGPDDITLSVPKLFFGYATGSNLLFPFSVGAAAVLFPERCTPELLFDKIERHRPTILVNVPTMVNKMLAFQEAEQQDLSCLRLATSAGEALPADLHQRWNAAFGTDLLDGLGTAEQWHIFLSNRPGEVRAGTLGRVVPGFELKVCDQAGNGLPDGEVGTLWVGGDSRATCYWQRMQESIEAFRGRWYVSGDMVVRDAEGYFTYCGRRDDMLKVSGKWLAPAEVENCLMQHPAVSDVAVVGVDRDGLVKPKAYVVATDPDFDQAELANTLQDHVKRALDRYKCPRQIEFLHELPRTHLGKVDRGALKRR